MRSPLAILRYNYIFSLCQMLTYMLICHNRSRKTKKNNIWYILGRIYRSKTKENHQELNTHVCVCVCVSKQLTTKQKFSNSLIALCLRLYTCTSLGTPTAILIMFWSTHLALFNPSSISQSHCFGHTSQLTNTQQTIKI